MSDTFPVIIISIDKIIVGDRLRNDLGDLGSLKDSIAILGLLQPIVVEKNNKSYKLLGGLRRLTACQQLGWKMIPCHAIRGGGDANGQK